jgi:hypothetical protein
VALKRWIQRDGERYMGKYSSGPNTDGEMARKDLKVKAIFKRMGKKILAAANTKKEKRKCWIRWMH